MAMRPTAALRAAAPLALALGAVAQVQPIEQVNTRCLVYQGDGCHKLTDKTACLNSRDGRYMDQLNGRTIRGDPCVWFQAQSGGSKCEPFSYIIGNPAVQQPAIWVSANCLNLRTIEDSLNDVGSPTGYPASDFAPVSGGEGQACRGVSVYDDGKGPLGTGGNQEWSYSIWSTDTLDQCKALCKSGCTGVEFRAADKYCEIWWDLIINSAPKEGFSCHRREMTCLTSRVEGCGSLKSESECVSSKDGRTNVPGVYNGIHVHGSSCVWCGGKPCQSGSDDVCQPLAMLHEGGTSNYSPFFAKDADFKVATCETRTQVGTPMGPPVLPPTMDNPAAAVAPAPTVAPPPAPPAEDTSAAIPVVAAAAATAPNLLGAAPTEEQPVEAESAPAAPNATAAVEAPAEAPTEAPVEPLVVTPPANETAAAAALTSAANETAAAAALAATSAETPAPAADVPAPAAASEPADTAEEEPGTAAAAQTVERDVAIGAPALAPAVAPAAPVGGRFVTDNNGSQQVYWHDSLGKHPLPEGTGCDICGCDAGNVAKMPQADLDLIPTADAFHCIATAPAAAELTTGGKFVKVVVGADDSSVAGASATPASGDGASATPASGDGAGESTTRIYWQDASGVLHLVPPDFDSKSCDVNMDEAPEVPSQSLQAAVIGSDFDCSMVDSTLVLAGVEEKQRDVAFGPGGTEPALATAEAAETSKGGSSWLTKFGVVPVWVTAIAVAAYFMLPSSWRKGKTTRCAVLDRCCRNDQEEMSSDDEEAQSYELHDSAEPGAASREVNVMASAPRGAAAPLIPAPQMASGHQVYYAAAPPVAQPSVFDMIDQNHDGVLSREEWQRYAFDAFDRNHDGRISQAELADGRRRP